MLFDFDGVLFEADAFATFLRSHCRRQWWRLVPASPLLLAAAPLVLMRLTRRRA